MPPALRVPELQVSFRDGRAYAAYYYLPRRPGDDAARTEKVGHGLLVDYAEDGRPIGIEILAPARLGLAHFNELLERLGEAPVTADVLAPLAAA